MLKFAFLLVTLSIVQNVHGKFRFDNYTLYKALPANLAQVSSLQELHDADIYDFWSDPVPNAEYVTILSGPENKVNLEHYFSAHGINYEITLPDIQSVIDNEKVQKYVSRNLRSMEWTSYYDLDDINAWIDDLAAAYPSVVTIISGGTSFEGRDIKGIRISHGPGRRVIFIEGGIHSREWISPAVVNYITNELLTSEDPETQAAANDFDWYIFPVTNPDGYVWTHTEFRLWRKNRRPIGTAFGVDLNRNWNSNWLVIGASSNPVSETYAGLGPFSEPETRTLSEYIISLGDRIDLYLSFHSSGQLLLLPFGNTTEPLANYQDAITVGRRAMGALSVRYGTPYTTGNVAEAIYHASGSSTDWAKDFLDVPLVYCYELRDRGVFGHLLPADQILPTGEETMDSVVEIIHQAKRLGYMNKASAPSFSFGLIMAFIFLINVWNH